VAQFAEVARASRPCFLLHEARSTPQFSFRCLQGSVIIAAFRHLLKFDTRSRVFCKTAMSEPVTEKAND
jgi:hypothetical protein